MNTSNLLAALVASIGAVYPTRTAAVSAARAGRVSCVVEPSGGEWEAAQCAPYPVTLDVEVSVLAAHNAERGVADLIAHLDPVAELVRAAGFTTTGWRADQVADLPAIVIAATAYGEG